MSHALPSADSAIGEHCTGYRRTSRPRHATASQVFEHVQHGPKFSIAGNFVSTYLTAIAHSPSLAGEKSACSVLAFYGCEVNGLKIMACVFISIPPAPIVLLLPSQPETHQLIHSTSRNLIDRGFSSRVHTENVKLTAIFQDVWITHLPSHSETPTHLSTSRVHSIDT